MNIKPVVFRSIDAAGCVLHIPYVGVITKLIEELMDSQQEVLLKIDQIKVMDKAEFVGLIESAEMAFRHCFNEEMSDEFREQQLLRACTKFNLAYYTLILHPRFAPLAVRAAGFMAICHFLLGHRQSSADWIDQAIELNAKYHYPQDHGALLKWKAMLEGKALPFEG